MKTHFEVGEILRAAQNTCGLISHLQFDPHVRREIRPDNDEIFILRRLRVAEDDGLDFFFRDLGLRNGSLRFGARFLRRAWGGGDRVR